MTGELFDASLPQLAKQATLEACRLIGLGHFRPDEREDLEQEFLLQLWRKRERLDSAALQSWAYPAVVMRNRGRDLLRYEYAPNRDRRKRDALHDAVDALDRRISPRTVMDEPDHGLRIDVHRVVAELPPAKRQFPSLLNEYGIVGAARQLRISRSTASRWKVEIRELFLRSGVGPGGTGEARPCHPEDAAESGRAPSAGDFGPAALEIRRSPPNAESLRTVKARPRNGRRQEEPPAAGSASA